MPTKSTQTFTRKLLGGMAERARPPLGAKPAIRTRVIVSELMLQQTQVSRVSEVLTRGSEAIPDGYDLARAKPRRERSLDGLDTTPEPLISTPWKECQPSASVVR